MKRIFSFAIFASILSTAAMAQTPAKPATPAVPAPPKAAHVELAPMEIQIISAALNIAAKACDTDATGCQIGLLKAPVIAKLNAAAQALDQPEKK